MYKNKKISVIVPCYNEASQIGNMLGGLPEFIDQVIVVDDASSDKSVDVVASVQEKDQRVELLRHSKNQGNGAARITGMKRAKEIETDVIVLMDGDGQMNPDELPSLLDPITSDEADYVKGNRFFSGVAWRTIPKWRYLGNATLSLLTKIVSGYWHLADSQTGYIAINRDVLDNMELDHLYPDYGFPNDLLIHANVANARAIDVPISPVYNIGEKSAIKIWKLVPTIGWLLFRRFFWRMKEKYIIRDFHPLVFFYLFGFFLLFLALPLAIRLFWVWQEVGRIPKVNALALMFAIISGMQAVLFAMWFDMDYNKKNQ